MILDVWIIKQNHKRLKVLNINPGRPQRSCQLTTSTNLGEEKKNYERNEAQSMV